MVWLVSGIVCAAPPISKKGSSLKEADKIQTSSYVMYLSFVNDIKK